MQNYPILDRQGFTSALHQGRGSAVLHVKEHGSFDLFEIILDACLFDRAYDQQCEGPRSNWLYSLIMHDDRICAAVVEAFEAPVDDQDLFQVANLVGLIAVNGNQVAAEALRRSWTENDLAGEVAIIMLDGLPAAIEVVRCLGQRLMSDPDEFVDGLDFLIEDEALRNQVQLELVVRASDDPAIKAYLAMHEELAGKRAKEESLTSEQLEQRRFESQRKYLAENPVSRIVDLAKSQEKVSPNIFRRFGRWASDAERQEILQILESEVAPEAQCRLLNILGRAHLLAWSDTIWNLAHSQVPEVRMAAVRALAAIKDSRVGDLARIRLCEDDFSANRSDEIELFKLNYLPGDEAIIIGALERINADPDGLHSIGMSALRVCEANPILQWMEDVACLPQWIANEARFDASEETRILVAALER